MSVFVRLGNRVWNRIKYEISKIIEAPFVASITRSYVASTWNSEDFRIDVTSPLMTDKNVSRMFWGYYEASERKLIRKYLRSESCVIELGGSLGVISSLIATRLAPDASLFIVEANPGLIPLIENNVRLNRQDIHLTVLNRAIAYVPEGEVSFWFDPHTAGSAIIEDEASKAHKIASTTLSDVVSMINTAPYTLVADIEGAEIQILKKDAKALVNCSKIIIELHTVRWNSQFYDINALVQSFQVLGFCVKESSENVYVFLRDL